MQRSDQDLASMGAEALPGDLGKINETRLGQPQAADSIPSAPQGTPLVGLIALVTHWLAQAGRRK
ncbi:MAG: hypothetical protein OEO84_02235 [Betaproteobacteria bacterium]|nr:hypothetical protein [Betaproteobacteria bacterium]